MDALVKTGIYRADDDPRRYRGTLGRIMNINAKGVFFATQAALPTMIAQKRGVT